MRMNHLKFALLVLVFLLSSNRFVSAAPISFDLSGTIEVSNDDGLLPSDLISGLTFTGRFTYDNSVPDSLLGDPLIGLYDHNPVGGPVGQFELSITIGQYDFFADPAGQFSPTVRNGTISSLPRGDSLGFSIPNFNSPTIDIPLGFVKKTSFNWTDSTETVFSSDALPSSLDINQFDVTTVSFFSSNLASGSLFKSFNIRATVDTITQVPEPTSFTLLIFFFMMFSIIFLVKQFYGEKNVVQ